MSLAKDRINVVVSVAPSSVTDVQGTISHDTAVGTTKPVLIGAEAKDFDGSAFPNVVDTEGDLTRLATSLYGVSYYMEVNEDGSKTTLLEEDTSLTRFSSPFLIFLTPCGTGLGVCL